MRSMKRFAAVAGAAALVLAACSGADDTGPLFPGGTTPPAPTTTEPSDTEATGPVQTTEPEAPTTVVATEAPASTESSVPPPSTVPGEPANLAEQHPLDGLTAEEMETFRAVLAQEGLLDGTQFPYV